MYAKGFAMIFYYTRTQKTKVAAEALHEITGLGLYALTAPVSEVKGFSFWVKAFKSVMSAKGCEVHNLPDTLPAEIYLCGPIWAGEMAGPLKYFLRELDISKTKIHCVLTGMQPTEKDRESARRVIERAGAQAGDIHLIATQKTMPEKDVLIEHLRALL
ncbi:MAG: hypothetical protein FWC16_08065 [Defluviitaleaceae bacterium]|nr:hypothetical protein [Defluviitaleaceae bacterium]MCL2274868.1 hypothetical protein [Defluviitaleaceae bacterium]